MRVTGCAIAEVLLLEPRLFEDSRGSFHESFNQREFERLTGLELRFVQDNHSRSKHKVLRGLHYQVHQPQGKLVRVVAGEVFDVAVDLRRKSPTFGKWAGQILSSRDLCQRWIPAGMAHGFLVLSDAADLLYKTTAYYAPEHERCIAWNDPTLAIDWPVLKGAPLLSSKDAAGKSFLQAQMFD